ncbi:MAG: gamma-glutamyltransferase family protein [Burkholderiaceae bacterium]
MTRGTISGAQPEAVEAGLDVLADGGNAVDAAIAAALVQTAVDPQMCGIAGFGSAHIYAPGAHHVIVDFHGRAPLGVRPDMWADRVVGETEDGYGFILKDRANEIGYQSITTPMTLRALDEILSAFGTRQIDQLMAPAIAYAENGFLVRPHVAAWWNETHTKGRLPHAEYISRYRNTASIYLKPDGSRHAVGEVLRNPDMANTLRRIAHDGVDDFYHGNLASTIVTDIRTNNGLITNEDMAAVSADFNKPMIGSYRGHRIATNPPPGGGILLLEMLNILEQFDLAAIGHNSVDYLVHLAEAMKIATVDKDAHVGDPRFVDVPVQKLTSKSYAQTMAERIRSGEKTLVPRHNPGGPESKDTTQITVVDENNLCFSMTHSLGMPAGVITPGLGFMYNGCMGVFDPRPGRAGSLAPGKSRFSAMCPTIVFKDDAPFFVTGAPGATYITMGVLQSILNVVDFGMDAQQAVSAPRISATSDTIELSNRIFRKTEQGLNDLGYPTRRFASGYMFAGVHAVRIVDGVCDGGADPGRDGMTASV